MVKSRLVFLLLIAVAAGCVLSATPAQAKLTGAVWTTVCDGTRVDHNVYNAKEDVYLNGGPFHESGAWVPDGDYYFMVTDPPGKVLLSQDSYLNRMIRIEGGKVLEPNPVPPYTNHQICEDTKREGNFTIQLMPYANSKNGEYKMWVTRVEDLVVADALNNAADPNVKFGFVPSESKTDNFRVRRGRLLIFGQKFNDEDGDGVWDFTDLNGNGKWDVGEPGEQPLPNWEIQLFLKVKNAWVFQSSSLTAGDGSYAFQITQAGLYRIYEVLQSDWAQTKPGSPNYYEINVTKPMLTAGTPLGPYDFGNTGNGGPGDATLAGIKFSDANQNCTLDDGELPLEGWLITITAGTMPGGVFVAADPQPEDLSPAHMVGPRTVPTGADGSWEKADLPRGWVYEVREELQPGWDQTAPCDALSANVVVLDKRYYVTVPEQVPPGGDDPAYLQLAFGNSGCGRIIVYKFEDHDANGIEDGLDGPLADWFMFLYDESGRILQWGPTDDAGYIEFPLDPEACLPFGCYIVAEMRNTTYTCTTCTVGCSAIDDCLAIDVCITPTDPVALVTFGNHYSLHD